LVIFGEELVKFEKIVNFERIGKIVQVGNIAQEETERTTLIVTMISKGA
jgi:hypothetical protein